MKITLVLLDGSKQILDKASDWPENYHFWLGQRVEITLEDGRKREFAVMSLGHTQGQPTVVLEEVTGP